MSWRDYWNADSPIYVSDRHKILHYALVARDVAALVPGPGATVLDHGCGEALSAGRVAAACRRLYLCDGAPLVRDRLSRRFADDPKVAVLAPEDVDGLPDGSINLIVVNSLLQYLSIEDLDGLLGLWRSKLAPRGTLVLADILPPDLSPLDDVRALLGFAWQGGFLRAALAGLVRTAFSDYRKIRTELGLTHHSEAEMRDLLHARGFSAERRPNLGHNPKRMAFSARKA